ncbi:hypothetical protein [Variovorax sp. UC122_21]|uniref:hypothetical protein n=1 Tax=Variovorax sp. UC122_21 TaxID=3374554 RepID=UPI0037580ABE
MNLIQPAGIASLAGEDCAIDLQEERLVELDCRAVALGGRGNRGARHGRTSSKKIRLDALSLAAVRGEPHDAMAISLLADAAVQAVAVAHEAGHTTT